MSGETLAWIKCGVALLAGVACWLLLKGSPRSRRWAGALLVLCSLAAVAGYFRFGDLPRGYVHRWEMFHYYLGSKYHAELGYKRLYTCVALADAEANVPGTHTRRLRDLETDHLISAEQALRASDCQAHFSSARWREFSADVSEFRRQTPSKRAWQRMQLDHGYNPPPLWSVIGGAIAKRVPPTPALLTGIALLDVVLMAGCIALLAWAFGLKAALIATVFWGTQAASDFGWTGGAFLRQDWLFCSVAAAALLRKRHFFSAGAALASAALLRFFPLLFFVGPLLVVAVRARHGTLTGGDRRFVLGLLTALVTLLLWSSASVGLDDYWGFLDHIRIRHLAQISNHMGLRTLFSYSSDTALGLHLSASAVDPVVPWQDARNARVEALWPWFVSLKLTLIVLALWVLVRVRTLWVALSLSVTLVPMISEPSCYYYSMWLLALPLLRVRPILAVPWLGLCAASQLIALQPLADDAHFAIFAGLYLLSGVALLALFARPPALRTWLFKEKSHAFG